MRSWQIDHAGYVSEYSPDHPQARSTGYVSQHRLVMECLLGRLLEPQEVVHHRNHKRHDNRAANLELMTPESHSKHHAQIASRKACAALTEHVVRAALVGRTTLEAARHLGVSHGTLRLRFCHLLNLRRSPNGPLKQSLVCRIRAMAKDPLMGTKQACDVLGISPATLRTACRIAGIQWVPKASGRPKGSGGRKQQG